MHMQATSVLGGVCLCVLAVSMLLCLYSHRYTEVCSYSTFITPAGIRMAAVYIHLVGNCTLTASAVLT